MDVVRAPTTGVRAVSYAGRRVLNRTQEQIVDVPLPPIIEAALEVVRDTPLERVLNRTPEPIEDVPVPRITGGRR